MKTKQMVMLALLLLGIVLGREAQAFYNPSTGRWLSRDPIEEKGGLNLHVFVQNCPNGKIDPDGRDVRRGIDGPDYERPSVPTGIYLCISTGSTARPYDHAWIQGDGWAAGFWPHEGGPKPPEGEGRGKVVYPDDPYYLQEDKSHHHCYQIYLYRCCSPTKFKKRLLDRIKQDQANPPRYSAIEISWCDIKSFNCGDWATSVVGKCANESCR